MKILYIHQYFKTPEEGGAIRSFYLATGLVSKNFEVELITAHNKHSYEIRYIDGIKVHYLPVPYANEMRFFARVSSFLKFFLRATILSLKIKNIDICYATSTPLTIGCISLMLKKIKNIPYVFEVRDLWPEAPIQLGIIKNKLLKSFLLWLEVKIYKEAKAIVALSPGIKSSVEQKAPDIPVYMIPNMADIRYYKESVNFETQLNHAGLFTIIYFGAIGKINKVDTLLKFAKEVKDSLPCIKFIILGEGAAFSNIKKMIDVYELENVEAYDQKSKKDLVEILKSADASYISYENFPVLETSSPNKFFDSLAAGKVIILNIKGWLHDLSLQNSAGIYVDPASAGDFTRKITPFVQNRKLLKTYQQNALKLAEEQFEKEELVTKLANLLSSLH